MTDRFWERLEKVLDVGIVVGVIAMTLLLALGVMAAAAWVVRFVF